MKNKRLIFGAILMASLMLTSCGGSRSVSNYPGLVTTQKKEATSTGTTGTTGTTVKIGTQTWTTKNLEVVKFRNGNPIPQARTLEEWKKAKDNKQPAWCYYDNDPANGTKYGKLYNWFAVKDPRGLAPAGYHVPTDAEWTKLTVFLGGEKEAGQKMKSTSGWNENGNGTNRSGFVGLPGGYRNVFDGTCYFLNNSAVWWSATEINTTTSWYRSLDYDGGAIYREPDDMGCGLSVRCIRD